MYKKRDKEDLLKRLRRIEGQVRGIHRMIEEDKYCVDILHQIVAARAALGKAGTVLLENHTRGCVADAIREERSDEAIDELVDILMKFVK